MIKKAFLQESRFRQFYSDNEPLVSFDNGYGIGQITDPTPSFLDAWNWKEHVKTVMNKFLVDKRRRAKNYLGEHGKDSYTKEQYDIETLAFYNGGGRYHKWNKKDKVWEENADNLCDPDSNRSWRIADNPNKTAAELLKLKEEAPPRFTGHCYAKHIIEKQGEF